VGNPRFFARFFRVKNPTSDYRKQMQQHHPRLNVNAYHGPKRQLLGTHGPPPAWKTPGAAKTTNANGRRATSGLAAIPAQPPEAGSKILISRLPADVTEQEVRVSVLNFFLPFRLHISL
jgi:hypothetical protein